MECKIYVTLGCPSVCPVNRHLPLAAACAALADINRQPPALRKAARARAVASGSVIYVAQQNTELLVSPPALCRRWFVLLILKFPFDLSRDVAVATNFVQIVLVHKIH